MRLWLTWFVVLLGLGVVMPSSVSSSPDVARTLGMRATQEHRVPRTVLGLYHSADEATPDVTRIHKFLEMPLNHLGYVVSYWDLKAGLPPADLLNQAAGVATWFNNTLPDSTHYFVWAAAAARIGKKFLVFESPGSLGTPDTLRAMNGFLSELGLRHTGTFRGDTRAVVIRHKNPDLIGVEEPLPGVLPGFNVVTALPGNGRDVALAVHLSVSVADAAPQADDAVLVSTNHSGSVVSTGYAIRYNPAKKKLTWFVDPIGLVAAAMGPNMFPAADTTTLAGRRMYFSHIDGDGWNNSTRIPQHASRALSSAEVVLQELIVPYPDLPVTVGLISCDIDPALKGRVEAADTARRLYALPQVEAASHTHTHPFDWPFYATYDRARELARLKPVEVTKPAPASTAGSGGIWPWDLQPAKPKPTASRVFIPAGPPPRYNTDVPFGIDREVAGSLRDVQGLLPPGKRAEVYLWSGDTRPFPAAIAATRKAKVRNLNGGDSRFDRDFPSLAYVPPISRTVAAERQIYSVNSNENTYTNEWTGPYDGFLRLRETLDRTERPRRLKPMNVYYHMYSGERALALAAVKSHLDHARASPVIPVTASRYAAIADSFFGVTITEVAPMLWRIGSRGDLQTIRFDRAEAVSLDLTKSEGVLGQTRHAGALYIALDRAHDAPVIALAEAEPGSGSAPSPAAQPYLIESRWDVSGVMLQDCGFSAKAQGFGRGEMTWAGLAPGTVRVSVDGADRAARGATEHTAQVSADGRLSVALDADARAGVTITVACVK